MQVSCRLLTDFSGNCLFHFCQQMVILFLINCHIEHVKHKYILNNTVPPENNKGYQELAVSHFLLDRNVFNSRNLVAITNFIIDNTDAAVLHVTRNWTFSSFVPPMIIQWSSNNKMFSSQWMRHHEPPSGSTCFLCLCCPSCWNVHTHTRVYAVFGSAAPQFLSHMSILNKIHNSSL